MNIGLVTPWCEMGAGMVSRAYRDLLSSRHSVFIFGRGGSPRSKHDPNWASDTVTWGTHFPTDLTRISWPEFSLWVKERRLDMLIFNEQNNWYPVVLCRRLLSIPIGTYVDYYRSDTVPFFALYDFLLCNTKRHFSVFSNHPGSIYIPWGTHCRLFTGSCVPLDPNSVTFFHSGGGDLHRKGTDTVVEAFRLLTGPCRLVLHVQTPLDRYPEIKRQCQEDPRIEVIEGTVTAPGLYHRGDIYVYPSILEGIGLTVPEALSSGLPAIVQDVPPMNEFVAHGENGRLVTPYEYRGRKDGYYWAEAYCKPEAIATNMQYYIDNRDSLTLFKRKARAYALERLDWSKNASGLLDILDHKSSSHHNRRDLSKVEWEALEFSLLPPFKKLIRAGIRMAGLHRTAISQKILYETTTLR